MWKVIFIFLAHPPQINDCYVDAVEYDGCNGEKNSQQIQNHIEDDLKYKNCIVIVYMFIYKQTQNHNTINSIQDTGGI